MRPYVPEAGDDDDDIFVHKKSSTRRSSGRATKATATYESDFEDEASEHESEIEIDEEFQVEDSEPESAGDTEEGYDSGVKLNGKKTNKKSNGTVKTAASTKQGKTGKGSDNKKSVEMDDQLKRTPDEPKGLDTGLPPLSKIDDIFEDVTAKALAMGLREFLQKTNSQPLRVATMCSGTESPLLALEMVQDALRSLGEPELQVDHL